MDTVELNNKIGNAKTKINEWVKRHKKGLIFLGVSGVSMGLYAICRYVDSMPVTVDDVTEITKFNVPELKNEITMYDDRIDAWVPVIRKLTDEEFKEIYKELEENPNKFLVNCLEERELLPNYLLNEMYG